MDLVFQVLNCRYIGLECMDANGDPRIAVTFTSCDGSA